MAQLIDLTGQVLDKLTVIEKAPSRARHVYWKCKCECGNECEISGESLRRKQPHNCGICTSKEYIKMQKKNYLIGKTFGKLTVIERTNKSNRSGVIWKCQCECGNIKEVPTASLNTGKTKSCGCLKLESHLIDITNKKFGKITALFFIQNESKWHCKCECGNECDIDSYNLRHGLTKSCGCINYSIGEFNIEQILIKNNIVYKKEYTESSLERKRFDFALLNENNNIIRLIEFDGEQHINAARGTWKNYESLEVIQQRDKEKNQWAVERNIPLVRIPYWERDNITLEMLLGDKYLIQ